MLGYKKFAGRFLLKIIHIFSNHRIFAVEIHRFDIYRKNNNAVNVAGKQSEIIRLMYRINRNRLLYDVG
jgi:hypothetical protein